MTDCENCRVLLEEIEGLKKRISALSAPVNRGEFRAYLSKYTAEGFENMIAARLAAPAPAEGAQS